jgi:predicted porin
MIATLPSVILLLLCIGNALANSPLDQSSYIGAIVGQSKLDVSDDAVSIAGAPTISFSKSESDVAGTLLFGYRVTGNVAAEGGYSQLGTFSANRDSATATNRTDSVSASFEAFHLSVVGSVPLSSALEAFGKVGSTYVISNTRMVSVIASGLPTVPPTVIVSSSRSAEWRPAFSMGADYHFTKSQRLRVEYGIVKNIGDPNVTGKSDMRTTSVGIVSRF